MDKQRPVQEMEAKWQGEWEKQGVYQAKDLDATAEKFYGLVEFPYPSGDGLHVGHVRSYTAIDAVTRKKRMEGKNVLYPMGWDAFGLPTENYAIKTKTPPAIVTQNNIATFKRQLKSLGLGFDWTREVDTTDPKYYKWTQWQFLQFFKHGLAYKAKSIINWCPKCKIGLANEEAQGGVCERCGNPVEKREKEQWMIAITKYAERLLKDLDTVDYLEKIKVQQVNWIGRSEGINITYPIEGSDKGVTVFTTRPDTNFGATFIALAPDGAFVAEHLASFLNQKEVVGYIEQAKKKTDTERLAEGKKKTGVFTGLYAVNGLTQKKMPIYVADFVLGGVGTGALVGVPGHDMRDFEFAQEMKLEVIRVVVGPDGDTSPITHKEQVQEETGTMINSGFLDGSDIHAATHKIMDKMVELGMGVRTVAYKLRDWVFSRQRYWGEPIPIINCVKCGYVAVPDEQLPVVLPEVEAYEPTDTGESPLAKIDSWVNTTCPTCGGAAKRETDTMPNWAGSSWYFLRYTDPQNDQEFASHEHLKYWMPVNLYNGGMEHTTLHLLYSRFWHKFLWDIGAIPKECGSEPYTMRRSHGLVLAKGGEKMSKSKGNVVNPDEIVQKYGADVLRLYELFMGPFDQQVPWDTNGIEGVRRFLDKVWSVFQSQKLEGESQKSDLERLYHQTIKKITEGIDQLQFNTCVSQMMILTNALQDAGGIPEDMREGYLKVLAPFAPHIAEELWHVTGHNDSIHRSSWPTYDTSKLKASTFELVVQINGKVRDKITVDADIDEATAKEKVMASSQVQKWLEGKEPTQIKYVPGKLMSIVV